MKHCLTQRVKNKRRFTRLIHASDDWYPSLEGGKVEMRFYPDWERISIWGDDDFGMEKFEATEAEFKELSALVVNQAMLKKRGFLPC